MSEELTISERIALIERKLQVRRDRTTRHVREVRADVAQVRSWIPIAAAAGALFVGFAAARSRRSGHAGATGNTGWLTAVVAATGTLSSMAMSPAGRTLWALMRKRKGSP